MVRPGVTTADIDSAVEDFILSAGATPSFKNYEGFPASACVSVNGEVVHGIPSRERVLKEGDIVSVDAGAYIDGFHGDAARTFPVGKISPDAARLIEVTRQCFYEGLRFARLGYRIGDISGAIQDYAESHGYSVVRELIGHGVGRNLHEAPMCLNYRMRSPGHPPAGRPDHCGGAHDQRRFPQGARAGQRLDGRDRRRRVFCPL